MKAVSKLKFSIKYENGKLKTKIIESPEGLHQEDSDPRIIPNLHLLILSYPFFFGSYYVIDKPIYLRSKDLPSG